MQQCTLKHSANASHSQYCMKETDAKIRASNTCTHINSKEHGNRVQKYNKE